MFSIESPEQARVGLSSLKHASNDWKLHLSDRLPDKARLGLSSLKHASMVNSERKWAQNFPTQIPPSNWTLNILLRIRFTSNSQRRLVISYVVITNPKTWRYWLDLRLTDWVYLEPERHWSFKPHICDSFVWNWTTQLQLMFNFEKCHSQITCCAVL